MESRELELLRPLGQGGFGTVWLAKLHGRDGFSRRVAVKLMKETGASADVIARQRDEARLLGLLQHPHIVQVFDLTEHNGLPAVIMEFVEGVDVSTLMKHTGPLPFGVAVSVAAGVAGALDAGWNALSPESGRPLRVIHRDIKPANVLVTIHGAVKVLDFGVARADFEREGHTQSMAFGTPRFMAPEQFLQGEVGAGNDVYALAVTLWEMILGRSWERPPLGEERFAAKVAAQLADAPDSLGPLLGRMMAWAPEGRPSASEVREALEALVLPGESLRAWARRQVPPTLEQHALVLAQTLDGSSAGELLGTPGTPTPAGAARVTSPIEDSGVSLVQTSVTPALSSAPPPAPTLPVAPVVIAAGAAVLVLGFGLVSVGMWSAFHKPGAETAPATPPIAEAPRPASPMALPPADEPPAEATAAAPTNVAPSPPRASRGATSPVVDDVSRQALVAGLGGDPDVPPSSPRPAVTAAPVSAPVAPAPKPEPRQTASATPAASPAPAPEPLRTRPVRVLADVIGAQVRIDGSPAGSTPLPARNLPYGEHTVEVDVDGVAARRSFTVDGNLAGTLRYLSKENRWVWE